MTTKFGIHSMTFHSGGESHELKGEATLVNACPFCDGNYSSAGGGGGMAVGNTFTRQTHNIDCPYQEGAEIEGHITGGICLLTWKDLEKLSSVSPTELMKFLRENTFMPMVRQEGGWIPDKLLWKYESEQDPKGRGVIIKWKRIK